MESVYRQPKGHPGTSNMSQHDINYQELSTHKGVLKDVICSSPGITALAESKREGGMEGGREGGKEGEKEREKERERGMEECGKRELDATTVHICIEYWLCSLNCHSPPNIPLFSDYSGTQQRSIVRLTKFENKSGANQLHSWLTNTSSRHAQYSCLVTGMLGYTNCLYQDSYGMGPL